MGIFSLFGGTKKFFSDEEQANIINAIRNAEKATSGEIRIYVESKNPYVDPIERAKEIFFNLKMQQTEHRNAVILYLATRHREIALFGDEGIYKALGKEFWEAEINHLVKDFSHIDLTGGKVECIQHVGQALKEKFPFEKDVDKNELPDNIVFGN